MNRRAVLLATAVGVAAAGAGLFVASRRQPAPVLVGGDAGPAQAVNVWSLRFEQPGGGEIALASLRGKPLVLNFWATWCPPCVEEMPLLDRFQREHAAAGWQVLGLAVDNATAVREFLTRHPVSFRIGLAGMEGTALARSLGNTSGALPFSVIFDARGEPAARKLGVLSWDELTAWAARLR